MVCLNLEEGEKMGKVKDVKELWRFYTNVQKYAGTIMSKKFRVFVFMLAMVVFYTVWEYQVVKFSPKQVCAVSLGDFCVIHAPDVSRTAICDSVCGAVVTDTPENICGPANLFYWFLVGVATGMMILVIMVEGETVIDLWKLMKIFKKEDNVKASTKKGKR